MARTAAAGSWSLARACGWAARRCLGGPCWFAAVLILVASTSCGLAQQDPVKGEASFTAADGYARLVLKLAEDVESEVTAAGSIVVIRFKRPVDVAVEKLAEAVPGYIGSVRRDPDGAAIRLSLARRVTINTMTAGERVFVDLLPDGWSGPPPALPLEVVRELSARARAAERALRQARATSEVKQRAPIRVRASVQPTFVRFVFEMPDGVGISSVLNDQKLTLLFNAALTFDLADAKVAAPPNIASISQKIDGDNSAVEVTLIGEVDVHSFREDKNYIIDVAFQQAEKPPSPVADALHAPEKAVAEKAAPEKAVPEKAAAPMPAPVTAVPAATAKPVEESPPPRQSSEIVPPNSEMLAAQAKIEIKPEAASRPEAAPKPEAGPKPETAPKPVAAPEAPMSSPPAKEATAQPMPEKPVPVAIPPKIALAAARPAPAAGIAEAGASVDARRDSDGLRLIFNFASATHAALFRRADTVWMVFDTTTPIDVGPIRDKGGAIVAETSRMPLEKGQAIRVRLNRPQMASLQGEERADGMNWTVAFADIMQSPTQPLIATRNISDRAHANVTVPFPKHGLLHRLTDPGAGDTIMVVTALPPVRGFIKRQDFVELSLLESIHGVAIRSNADDVVAEIAPDKIILGRPGGLTLSSADVAPERATSAVRPIFDSAEWQKNLAENFIAREQALVNAAAATEPDQRVAARIDLARFYLSRGMYYEAKAVLDLVLADSKPGQEEPVALMVHAVASILIGHPARGLKDLANPAIGNNYDAQLWKALAYARQRKWADAREKFKNVEFAITSLPIELQRVVVTDAMRASLEVKDFSGADKRGTELEVIGLPPELKPAMAVLRGQLAEGLGHDKDALAEYQTAVASPDRAAAAEAKLLEVLLRQKHDEITPVDALRELETLSVTWRGDGIEVKTLQVLAQLYSDAGRYGESLAAARTATRLQPNSEAARQAQDAASALFAQLFLSSKGDDLPPVDALAIFYEFRDLTPIGRRGDEMIRRLADRLVAVDLLDQASELLQYQVDHRLEGAARAQVAARLAMVYLANRKPDRAIAALRTTRIADLSGELRQQRLLLEARAQSDIGRHDLAVDIISNIGGREAIRLRSDIYWASRHWREASEQIELYYADRWRDFKPLNPVEKGDVIRAMVGYALAEDAIGLARFREKYAPLMSAQTDRLAFDIASQPAAGNSADFAPIAKMAASVDTLDGFLREMKTRFPDATARAPLPPGAPKADPLPTGSLPAIVGLKRVDAAR
jgi:hypothetical protein